MPQATEAHDADLLAGADLPVAQRRVGRDARADQRRRARRIEPARQAQHEMFLDDDRRGVAAEGHAAEVLVRSVVGEGRRAIAELLLPALAARAGTAGIDQAAHGDEIADLELGGRAAGARDAADDLVARHAGVDRGHEGLPLVAGLVDVGVTDAAVQHLDLHIVRLRVAALDGRRCERAGGGGGGKGTGREARHGRRIVSGRVGPLLPLRDSVEHCRTPAGRVIQAALSFKPWMEWVCWLGRLGSCNCTLRP